MKHNTTQFTPFYKIILIKNKNKNKNKKGS
jgi:hypothetical protein